MELGCGSAADWPMCSEGRSQWCRGEFCCSVSGPYLLYLAELEWQQQQQLGRHYPFITHSLPTAWRAASTRHDGNSAAAD